MQFGFPNAAASFQSYIDWILKFFLKITVIFYVDYISRFWPNLLQIEKHIRKVFNTIFEVGLYVKLSGCLFSVSYISFFGFILEDKSVKMEKMNFHDLKLIWARICLWDPKISWICQFLPKFCEKFFKNNISTHRYCPKSKI